MSTRRCETCDCEDTFTGHPGGDSKTELRPYGPGGSLICFRCAHATPQAEKQTERAFGALLDANETLSPTATTLLTSDGPVPLDARLIDPTAEVVNREAE